MFAADTSVSIPFLVSDHPFHAQAVAALAPHRPVLAGHALFETVSVLTRLPGGLRLSSQTACRLVQSNFGEPLWLTTEGNARVHALLLGGGIVGRSIYDALVAQAALDHQRTLLTRDRRAERTYRAVGVAFELVG